ncbi:uncharacterized protein N7446_010710 [Penicillium canescens]|uniref:HMG box domain-containing protein n=1 Tax=Penicillium canescens TaxID=5083 RepID=A0AAD6N827_PENCN|nr:uncharacterized protein N7446_010710 [Penicillium canescens]KAJ6041402.1 hypothetical protein N7460_006792 [Penicillium canescens]KAJ6050601.1 hypothetical protein N7446_010710 [Penicillium canescens]KAJ6065819.1 hypothetical protein N7444_001472 [Penicillium canescens]
MMTISTKKPKQKTIFPFPDHWPQCSEETEEGVRMSTQKRAPWYGNMPNLAAWHSGLPLSSNMTDIPIEDMTTWVHRSPDERKREEDKHGKVLRPRNCFILYKSAYAPRIKNLLQGNKSQAVKSIIAGRSWNMETPDVKQKYKMLADIERHRHAEAHPDYRFSPRKPRKQSPVMKEASTELKVLSSPISKNLEPSFEDTESTALDTEGSWWLHGEDLRYYTLENLEMDYSFNLVGLPEIYQGIGCSN